jgi:ribosomal protein S18 acetylase RimI-like enzyme
MLTLRVAQAADLPVVWALSVLPNVGHTADPATPFPLRPAQFPPAAFEDLADPERTFAAAGGELLVADLDGEIAAMGGFRPVAAVPGRVEILRVRVHPARRRLGLGRAIMARLEADAVGMGYRQAWLDTASNQPEAMAFYSSIGYRQVGQETQPDWDWTLVYYLKDIA